MNDSTTSTHERIQAFLGGTPATLAAMAATGLEEHLGRKPTSEELRVMAAQVRAMSDEVSKMSDGGASPCAHSVVR